MMVVKISTGTGIRAGRPRALFELPPADGLLGFSYDITPDGEHFVVNKEENANSVHPNECGA